MEWQDTGTVLKSRRHGETSAIAEIFTRAHGRHAGLVRGAFRRVSAPGLQPGTLVDVTWRSRLDEHLGTFTVEPIKSRYTVVLSGRLELAALNAVTALLSFALPEREPQPKLYEHTVTLLDMIGETDLWPLVYLRWELALLEEMGFGLDLSECAVTGARDMLAYVSPRSGRAVSVSGAGDWKDRLLPLPPCMLAPTGGTPTEIAEGLRTTGYFLVHRLAGSLGERPLPQARQRFADLFSRRSGH